MIEVTEHIVKTYSVKIRGHEFDLSEKEVFDLRMNLPTPAYKSESKKEGRDFLLKAMCSSSLTQRQFARKLGVSYNIISNVASERSRITDDLRSKITKFIKEEGLKLKD